MDKMTILMENWYLFVAAISIAGVAGVAIGKFLSLPTAEQIGKCKEWLLLAVTEAERQMGGGTGKLKLRAVYDLFLQRWPEVAKAVSFDTFSAWVDEALEEMRKMLETNKDARALVEGEQHG